MAGVLGDSRKRSTGVQKLLVKYYEGEDISVIANFMKERCRKTIGKNVTCIGEQILL
jgi:hypothetical protein